MPVRCSRIRHIARTAFEERQFDKPSSDNHVLNSGLSARTAAIAGWNAASIVSWMIASSLTLLELGGSSSPSSLPPKALIIAILYGSHHCWREVYCHSRSFRG